MISSKTMENMVCRHIYRLIDFLHVQKIFFDDFIDIMLALVKHFDLVFFVFSTL